jgi:exodeoxyribonuclease V gamma subunit
LAYFTPPTSFELPLEEKSIDIKDLRSCASHPIKFNLRKKHQIYLETREDREIKDFEQTSLSSLDKYMARQRGIKEPLEKVFSWAEKEGRLPFGLFKEAACSRLAADIHEWQQALDEHHLKRESIFSIEFCTACQEPLLMGKRLYLPALKVDGVSIKGSLPAATPKGLLLTNKGAFSDLWKAWPDFLLYHYAASFFSMEKQLIALQGGAIKEAPFNDPIPYIKDFLGYYSFCTEHVSPLHPDWLGLIVKGNSAGLQSALQNLYKPSFGGYQSPELKWVFHSGQLPSAAQIIDEWKEAACRLSAIIQELE